MPLDAAEEPLGVGQEEKEGSITLVRLPPKLQFCVGRRIRRATFQGRTGLPDFSSAKQMVVVPLSSRLFVVRLMVAIKPAFDSPRGLGES